MMGFKTNKIVFCIGSIGIVVVSVDVILVAGKCY